MEEYTNPAAAEAIDDGSDFFLDTEHTSEGEVEEKEPEHTGEDKSSPAAPEKNEAAEPEKPQDAEQKVKIKYNGEEREITLQEAVTLAQKGMNYDRAIERESKKYERERGLLDYYAKQSGMTYEEYTNYLDARREEVALQNELKAVREKNPDISDDLAREIAQLRSERNREKIEREEADRKAAQEAERIKPWKDFIARYPDVKDIQNLPPDVAKEIEAGRTPVEAMQSHEIAELKNQIEELNGKLQTKEKNQKNKEKAIGSVASSTADAKVDAFMAGLNG